MCERCCDYTVPPDVTVTVNKNDLTAGETALLTCTVEGRPDIQSVVWQKKNGQVLTSRRDAVTRG